MAPPPAHLSLARGVKPPLYQDAVARRALRPPLFRSVSVPSEPPPRPPPPAMDIDVTYAVVNKARRGGGAGGRGHAPSSDPAPPGCGHAPSGTSSLPASPRHRPSPSPAPPPKPSDGAYEVVTPQGDPGSPSPLGFNFRIPKPKGPRDPPAEWARV